MEWQALCRQDYHNATDQLDKEGWKAFRDDMLAWRAAHEVTEACTQIENTGQYPVMKQLAHSLLKEVCLISYVNWFIH
jgi:hypothetical protein